MRIVTRLSLNRLRTVARQREEYVGARLPEPLLTSHVAARLHERGWTEPSSREPSRVHVRRLHR